MRVDSAALRHASMQRVQQLRSGGVRPVWRYVLNSGPTLRYRRSRQPLSLEGTRILTDLNATGLATSTVERLTGDPTLLPQLRDAARRLEGESPRPLPGLDADGEPKGRDFLIELIDWRDGGTAVEGIFVDLALNTALKAPVDAYFGMDTRVADFNVWRTLPRMTPRLTQLWHRDVPEDRLLVKVFVYLEDVDEDAGPFKYALGTHGKGDRRLRLRSLFDGWNFRVDDQLLESRIDRGRLRTLTGPAGTVVFADTIGFHKGGFATRKPRLVMQTLYTSQAARPAANSAPRPDLPSIAAAMRPTRHPTAAGDRR